MKIQNIKNKVNTYFTKGNERSLMAKRNIVASLVMKGISILISLQVVPLTIGYINSTKYGIWLTLSSIIAWLSYFDLGFAHGFRNRFAEAKAKGDMKLAREYVSTTYTVLFLLFSVILMIVLIVNKYLNWSAILNIDIIYNEELHIVFGLLAVFFLLECCSKCLYYHVDGGSEACLGFVDSDGRTGAGFWLYLCTDSDYFGKFECFGCGFFRGALFVAGVGFCLYVLGKKIQISIARRAMRSFLID